MDDGDHSEHGRKEEWSAHEPAHAFPVQPASAAQGQQHPSHHHHQQQFPFPMGGPPFFFPGMHPGMAPGWGGPHGPPQSLMYLPMLPMMGAGQPGMMPMGYHPGGREMSGGFGGVASPGRGGSSDDAHRKRKEREETNNKWMTLDSIAPPDQGPSTCLHTNPCSVIDQVLECP